MRDASVGRAREVVRAYLDALGGDDPDRIAAFVTEDFENRHLTDLGEDSTGRDAYRERLPSFLAELPARRYEIVDLLASVPDRRAAGPERAADQDAVTETRDEVEVVVRYVLHARRGDHDLTVPGIVWCTVRDGAIARRIDAWDSQTVARQSGRSDEA